MNFHVRRALASDAPQATELVRRSILTLCEADHGNDPATLERWLGNKRPEYLERWIGDIDSFTVVGESDGTLCGIGLIHKRGEIMLFYVAPEFQREGVGRAICHTLEEHAMQAGLSHLRLNSTAAARAFYEALGYQSSGPAVHLHGKLWGYPYTKHFRRKR